VTNKNWFKILTSKISGGADGDDTLMKPEKKPPLGKMFWISVGWVCLNVFLAITANLLPIKDPISQDYNAISAGPSLHYLLGTDDIGRDILSRIIFGSRISIAVSFGAMLIAFGIGAPSAMLAALRRGRFDTILTTVMYSLLAFPAIIATISVLSFWVPRNLFKVVVVIGIASTPLVYRVIRTASLAVASRDFVTAAKVQGASDRRILIKEILPNIMPILLSFLLIGIASVVALEGALAFLGLSISPPTPSWGNMINESRTVMSTNPGLVIFPSLALCLFILSLNFIGDRLRNYFDVAEVKI
jgi:peptide/nickel transport system permease protein